MYIYIMHVYMYSAYLRVIDRVKYVLCMQVFLFYIHLYSNRYMYT